jgi:hypothetical protein
MTGRHHEDTDNETEKAVERGKSRDDESTARVRFFTDPSLSDEQIAKRVLALGKEE